jgi:hypothetical protein
MNFFGGAFFVGEFFTVQVGNFFDGMFFNGDFFNDSAINFFSGAFFAGSFFSAILQLFIEIRSFTERRRF